MSETGTKVADDEEEDAFLKFHCEVESEMMVETCSHSV